ncbi:MAG: DUF192 domain-containing protein, partial [Chloroflexota bacterium]
VLATQVDTASGFWAHFVGLMGRRRLPPGTALVFPGARAVHTHFLRFPIDLVFYDRDGRVVAVVHRLPPWRVSPVCRPAAGVIELPAGTVSAAGTRPGDLLAFS